MPNTQVLFLSVLLLRSLMCEVLTYNEVKKAFDEAMKNYSPSIRPVVNQSESVGVNMSFHLMRITSVRESEKTLRSTGFLTVAWTDKVMQNALRNLCRIRGEMCNLSMPMTGTDTLDEDFELNYLHVSPHSLWLPDLRIHNAVRRFGSFDREDALLSLFYTGKVLWVPGGEFETFCDMDVRKFPFDEHQCHFDIGPWQSNRETVTSNKFGVDLNYFERDGEWQITETHLSTAPYIIGGCCRYTIHIRRRPEILVATMILPTSILSFIGTLVFKLPTESGERVSLSLSVTLALILYLTIIQNILPRSVTKPSYFEILLCTQVLFNLMNVLINVINIYIYHKMPAMKLKKRSFLYKLFSYDTDKHPPEIIEVSLTSEIDESDLERRSKLKEFSNNMLEPDTISHRLSVNSTCEEDDPYVLIPSIAISHFADVVSFAIALLANAAVLLLFIVMVTI